MYLHICCGDWGNMNTLMQAIKAKGWSVSQAAKMAGLPYTTVYDIASDRRKPINATYATLSTLASVLDTTVAELVGIESRELTHDENELLSIYRSLSPFGKNTILLLARQLKSELAL